ncbi:hypothetical protein ABIA25_000886 [Sinorhizobium fredii]
MMLAVKYGLRPLAYRDCLFAERDPCADPVPDLAAAQGITPNKTNTCRRHRLRRDRGLRPLENHAGQMAQQRRPDARYPAAQTDESHRDVPAGHPFDHCDTWQPRQPSYRGRYYGNRRCDARAGRFDIVHHQSAQIGNVGSCRRTKRHSAAARRGRGEDYGREGRLSAGGGRKGAHDRADCPRSRTAPHRRDGNSIQSGCRCSWPVYCRLHSQPRRRSCDVGSRIGCVGE